MPNFGQEYHTAAYECDQNSLLQLATIFNWFQDAMDRYSRSYKLGYDFCQKKNITYIIKDYDVMIDTLPKWMDSVKITTDLLHTTSCSLFFKQTMINTETRQALLSSVSHIVLIDILNKRPLRLTNTVPLFPFKKNPVPVHSPSLPPLDLIHHERTQEITPDCIDFNQHVNNTNYIVFAERSLDPVQFKKEKLKRIQVAYRRAAVLGDKIKVASKFSPTITDHQLSSTTDENKCFAQVRFCWDNRERT